jgi:hypothetical protein
MSCQFRFSFVVNSLPLRMNVVSETFLQRSRLVQLRRKLKLVFVSTTSQIRVSVISVSLQFRPGAGAVMF